MFNSIWRPAHDAALKLYFSCGLSFSQISAKLNAVFGEPVNYSRNACIGRAHRLGLSQVQRAKVTVTAKVVRPPPIKRKRPPVPVLTKIEAVAIASEVIPRLIELFDLEPDDCRYPYGHSDFRFCGHPRAHEETSYCYQHEILCNRSRNE